MPSALTPGSSPMIWVTVPREGKAQQPDCTTLRRFLPIKGRRVEIRQELKGRVMGGRKDLC